MRNNQCILFAGNASQNLAKLITSYSDLPIQLGEIEHHKFSSGEWGCQFKENIRGADVFLLQSTSAPANDNLMQLLIMADAARRASAGRITAVLPFMCYSRQDRKDKPRVPISAKLVMNILTAAGVNRVVTMDLHAAQIAGFTDSPFDHLHFCPTLIEALKDRDINVVVAPDIGSVKMVTHFAEKMGRDVAFIIKKRKSDTAVEVTQFVGDVKNKNVLVLDDLTETAGTLISAATCCKNNGAKMVYCAVSHNCLSDLGYERLTDARHKCTIDKFYSSNSTDKPVGNNAYYTTIDVSNVFAKAIIGIHTNQSISSLFI